MEPPPLPAITDNAQQPRAPFGRTNSISQASEDSQTAQEFIESQLQLEADAREALPYQFDTCTRPLGPLRQVLFSCLTCNPPPSPDLPFLAHSPAGICYSCSISCHGEHTLVELFNKRNFVCDCGTTRTPDSAPCTLRLNEATGTKGGVTGEEPAQGNRYNHNFENKFCGCGEIYNAHEERGTMFQCMGLGTVEDGGCGEDWWHPECVVGLPRRWYETEKPSEPNGTAKDQAATVESLEVKAEAPIEVAEAVAPGGHTEMANAQPDPHDAVVEGTTDDDPPLPPGFPEEDEFEHFICYKCTEAFPWIKRYAGTPGFLPAVYYRKEVSNDSSVEVISTPEAPAQPVVAKSAAPEASTNGTGSKRKASDLEEEEPEDTNIKRTKTEEPTEATEPSTPIHTTLPPAPTGRISLFLKASFRDHLCRCSTCFPLLSHHPHLLEEEESYEPPMSEDGDQQGTAGHSVGTGSLLDRGEAALSNVDRVRAIEGVMVYNHLRDKVKAFLQPFAESGKAVGAEDIKAYFETLRGDAEAIKAARVAQGEGEVGGGEGGGDGRREQGGKSQYS